MGIRGLAVGLVAWLAAPGAALLVLLGDPSGWDVSGETVFALFAGGTAVFAALGALLWLPAVVWATRRLATAPWPVHAAVSTGIGALAGLVLALPLALASGNFAWPESLGPVLQIVVAAAAAGLLGRLLASAFRATGRGPRPAA